MIDITKCLGCRKGINLFIKEKDGSYTHIDFFATPEAGASYKCHTSNIEDYIEPNEDRGTFLPKKEYDEFFKDQGLWWEDVLALAHEVFNKDVEKVSAYFNGGERDNRIWNLPNEAIEAGLLSVSDKEILEEDYPNLIKFKK